MNFQCIAEQQFIEKHGQDFQAQKNNNGFPHHITYKDNVNRVSYDTIQADFISAESEEAMSNTKIYEIINERIIDRLEEAKKRGETFRWVKGWNGIITGNAITQKPYRGINALFLDGLHITYKQLCSFQGQHPDVKFEIEKGTKQHTVYYFNFRKVIEETETENGIEKVAKTIPLIRFYKVFAVADIKNLAPFFAPEEHEHTLTEEMLKADTIIQDYCKRDGVIFETKEGSDRCFYNRGLHKVVVPPLKAFNNAYEGYSAYFHELVHSTSKKLERKLGDSFGSSQYSKEELIAEIGSQMLMAKLQMEQDDCFDNSLAYIQGWLKYIKDNKEDVYLISSACNKAQKAVDYILNEMYEEEAELSE